MKKNIIPPNAEKVFSGVRTQIYQWDQEMYDGSTERFECMRFMDWAFAVPVLPSGKILLTLQDQPARHSFIWLPGWSFDFPEEDPLDCAKRELLEETGYASDDWELWHTHAGTNNTIVSTYFYIAHDAYRVWEIQPDPGEKISLLELSFDEFLLLSEDENFTHWTLLPYLFRARIYREKYDALKEKLRI